MTGYFIFLAVAGVICVADWRKGVYITILVGFLQDPLRKMMPGQPVYIVGLSTIFLLLTLIGSYTGRGPTERRLTPSWERIRRPFRVFIIIVLVLAGVLFVRRGNFIVPAIGILAYLSPLPAIYLAYRFPRDKGDVYRFLIFYAATYAVVSTGLYLSFLGYDWNILEPLGGGLIIYPTSGGSLRLNSGFMRSSEIAAWHAGASACILIIMAVSMRGRLPMKGLFYLASAMLLGGVFLTGRRKFLVEIILFVALYTVMLLYFRRGALRLALTIALIGGVSAVGANQYLLGGERSIFYSYTDRKITVQDEGVDRVYKSTVGAVRGVIRRNGLFGAGPGAGSQGSQYFGGGVQMVGGSAEGGLAKVLAELGVPGLLAFFWLALSLFRSLWEICRGIRAGDVSRITVGLLAFVVVNGAVYSIAHQAFGDPFILSMLGWCVGLALAAPEIDDREETREATAKGPAAAERLQEA